MINDESDPQVIRSIHKSSIPNSHVHRIRTHVQTLFIHKKIFISY